MLRTGLVRIFGGVSSSHNSATRLFRYNIYSQESLPSRIFRPLKFSSDASTESDGLLITDNCIQRMRELQKNEKQRQIMLRLTVESGGCSGFQYGFSLDDKEDPDDRIFEREGIKVVVDKVSYDLVKGATIDYVEELIRSSFMVAKNPNAELGCSCGVSFTVK